MNEIKLYLKSSGSTAELYKDFNLYQGSYRNVQITIYVPSAMMYSNADNTYFNSVQTGAIMTAPNGAKVVTRSYNAVFVKTEVQNGVEYAVYTQTMPKEYALYAGTQLIVCNVVNIDNTDKAHPQIISITTSQRAPLTVLESAYLDDDELLTPSEGEVIEGLINDLQQRLNEGEFAARAIYAWNSTYTYGAGELVFYPQKGTYGVFLKSLTDNNKAAPYVDGVLDTGNWLLVSDFNILTELYSLKGDIANSAAIAAQNAQAAGQSASAAASSSQQAAQSAMVAENAAQRIESQAQYLDEVKDGTLAVPKATSDGNGENIAEQFADINEKIPSTASAENQLADKAFVNSSINNMAAFYITYNENGDAFPTRADLLSATTFYSGGEARVPTQNDYAIVLGDESQPKGVDDSYPTTRYSYQGGTYPDGQWDFQYVVNNTSLTQAQVDAINSGITAELVAQIGPGNVLSVNGETGAVTITPAKIGAVNKSGDTMTGNLSVANGYVRAQNGIYDGSARVYSSNNKPTTKYTLIASKNYNSGSSMINVNMDGKDVYIQVYEPNGDDEDWNVASKFISFKTPFIIDPIRPDLNNTQDETILIGDDQDIENLRYAAIVTPYSISLYYSGFGVRVYEVTIG